MRNLDKLSEPDVLITNKKKWLTDYKADMSSLTKKYRYRHKDIKDTLKNETGAKCIYCESKIGHNTPGDIEHKIPSSKDIEKHFEWSNLTIACTECNRRKNDFYDKDDGFLDPYNDNVEEKTYHAGPILLWRLGDLQAEKSLRILQLHDGGRGHLLARKLEKIEELNNLLGRIQNENDSTLNRLLSEKLNVMKEKKSEYSGMVIAILDQCKA